MEARDRAVVLLLLVVGAPEPEARAAGVADVLATRSAREADAIEVEPVPRTVNGTGHTDPSEFCATSI